MTLARLRGVVSALAFAFVLSVALGAMGVVAPRATVAAGALTTLVILSGDVWVSRAGGDYRAAVDGAMLSSGDTVRTGPDSRAVITYFEGSTVTVEPESELRVDAAATDSEGNTIVLMTQSLGRTWHVVTKLVGGSRYEVRTPTSTASVRGTAFEVGLARDERSGEVIESTITTTEGAAATTAPPTTETPAPSAVVVVAGFTTTVRSGEAQPPAPKPAAEAARTVSVSVTGNSGVVVDPLGRANGVKDGKVVIQTPGAQVRTNDGKVTVVLPNIPDGKLSTVISTAPENTAASREVEVTTTVQERGKDAVTISETVVADGARVVTGVEVTQSEADKGPQIRQLQREEKLELKEEKVGSAAPPPAAAARAPVLRGGPAAAEPDRPDRPAPEAVAETGDAQAASPPPSRPLAPGPIGRPGGNVAQVVPPQARSEDSARQAEEARREEAKKEAERRAAEQIRRAAEDAKRRAEDEQRKAEDAQKAAEGQRKRSAADAERLEKQRREAEDAKRKAEDEAGKAAAESAKRRAAEDEARQKAEDERRLEDAKKAADEASKRAERESKASEAAARKFAEAVRAAEAAVRRASEESDRKGREIEQIRDRERERRDHDDDDRD